MANETKKNGDSLLTFPCNFTIKVFGQGSDEFEHAVLMIINKHVSNAADRAIQTRDSENGKYRSLSITVHIESKQQLDAIYHDLSNSPHVLMAL